LYFNHPELARLVAWQQVSDEHELLICNDFVSPNHWHKFMQNAITFNKKQLSEYKNIIFEDFYE